MNRAGCWLVVVGLVGSAAQAHAQARRGFEVEPVPELAMTLGMMAVAVAMDREKKNWGGLAPCGEPQASLLDLDPLGPDPLGPDPLGPDQVCDASKVLAADRWVTTMNTGWARPASDIGMIGLLAAPLGLSVIDRAGQGGGAEGLGEDALVIGQTYALTLLGTNLIKFAVRRPRPLTHNPEFDRQTRFAGDSRLSFPSGHTSMSFSAASVGAFILFDRWGINTGTVTAVVAGYAWATTVGGLRIIGGKHFLTDVIAGAVLGLVAGWAVPILHRGEDPADSNASALRSASGPVMMSWSGAF